MLKASTLNLHHLWGGEFAPILVPCVNSMQVTAWLCIRTTLSCQNHMCNTAPFPAGQQQICLSRNRLVQKSQAAWIDDELFMCWTRPILLENGQ